MSTLKYPSIILSSVEGSMSPYHPFHTYATNLGNDNHPEIMNDNIYKENTLGPIKILEQSSMAANPSGSSH